MEKDPQVVARLAKQRDDENWRFRSFLKWYSRLSDARLNATARRFGEEAAAQIDCLECGACCRETVVPLEDDEITALATATDLSESQFRDRYVRRVEHHEQAIDGHPCPFQEGNRCTVYAARSRACRGYPYIGGDIRSRILGILERAGTCPIVFEMLERLKQWLGFARSR